MPKKKPFTVDLSDLPPDWTMRDVEKRMPEDIRKRRWPYKVDLMVNPLPTTPPGVTHAEFYLELNYDERDALSANLQPFVESGRLVSYKLSQIGIGRHDFADAIIKCLSEKK